MRILLMEDDPILGETIQEILMDATYDVDWVQNGELAAEASYENRYDLYIFDINVPEINGFKLLEALRDAEDSTPTIFMSALTDMASIAKGFSLGADDYLKKPFNPEELLIRVHAKLARHEHKIVFGEISYDTHLHEIRKGGKIISLGSVQTQFLKHLITNVGHTLPKESFFEMMDHPSDTALRVAINKLKQTTGWNIQNIRGLGYRIDETC